MSRERGLGKGFDALLPTALSSPQLADRASGDMVRQIAPNAIAPNPQQPRTEFGAAELESLASSIRQHGVLQPIVVSDLGGGKYELVAGERRLRASKLAGINTIPAIVRSFDEQQKLELALIENLQRSDLNPLETAAAYRKLIDEFNLTVEAVSQKVGRPRPTVTNTIRLLGLRPPARDALLAKTITEGHAKAILAVTDLEKQDEVTALIIKNGWSVRQAEEFGRAFMQPAGNKEKGMQRIAGTNELTERLAQYLGTSVKMQPTAKGGRLVIEYANDAELQRIAESIRPAGE